MLFLFLCILLIVVIHTVVVSVCLVVVSVCPVGVSVCPVVFSVGHVVVSVCPVVVSVGIIFVFVRMVYFLCAYCNCISTGVMNLSATDISIFPSISASFIINDNDVCEILLTVMY
jgi:hypothetical protein